MTFIVCSLSQAILKLNLSVRGHFVSLIKSGMHKITCIPGLFFISYFYFTTET